ncbi:dynein regulatory complex protein 10 [Nematostella vectensis]|uniref:dynein regulatory complex protein 10 n=1 Tax=Nematostella vectensis TaxID=45351 RepID=UPI00139000F8|nr:dynein regulatory complex protein 10 [Nematostella vectensis]
MAPVESPPGGSTSDTWIRQVKASPSSNLPKGFAPDPCRILEPNKKNLHMLESQRIMAVLEDTILRLELATILGHVMRERERFGVVLGTDLVELLDYHASRMERYEHNLRELELEEREMSSVPVIVTSSSDSERDSHESPVSPPLLNQPTPRWHKLKQDTIISEQGLKFSLMDILRHFKKNPKAVEVILGSKHKTDPVHQELLQFMTQLSMVMKERLLTTPTEEFDRKGYIVDILTRERKTNAAKGRLQARCREAVRDKEHEVSKRNTIIAQLKSELSMINNVTHEAQRKTLSDAAKQCSTEIKTSENKKMTIREDMITKRKHVRDRRREHREEETVLRKRAFKIGTEVYNWIQKYDADMGAKQDELDKVAKLYEEEKQDLREMEQEFQNMEAKYNAILEERRLAAEAEKKRQQELVQRNYAAVRIQAVWRGFRVRKALKGGKKGAKKAKKGKK